MSCSGKTGQAGNGSVRTGVPPVSARAGMSGPTFGVTVDLVESVHGRRGGRGPQRRGGEGGNRLSPARPQRGRAGERRFGRIFLSEIPSFGRRERPRRGRGQRQGGSAHRRDGDGLAGPLGMGHVTGGGAWRGCGDAGGVGGVLSGRLARGKSFFQKTLEAARGVFWPVFGCVDGGGGYPRSRV